MTYCKSEIKFLMTVYKERMTQKHKTCEFWNWFSGQLTQHGMRPKVVWCSHVGQSQPTKSDMQVSHCICIGRLIHTHSHIVKLIMEDSVNIWTLWSLTLAWASWNTWTNNSEAGQSEFKFWNPKRQVSVQKSGPSKLYSCERLLRWQTDTSGFI